MMIITDLHSPDHGRKDADHQFRNCFQSREHSSRYHLFWASKLFFKRSTMIWKRTDYISVLRYGVTDIKSGTNHLLLRSKFSTRFYLLCPKIHNPPVLEVGIIHNGRSRVINIGDEPRLPFPSSKPRRIHPRQP